MRFTLLALFLSMSITVPHSLVKYKTMIYLIYKCSEVHNIVMEVSALNQVAVKNLKGVMTYLKPDIYDKLKALAENDERSVSNLAAKILGDWVEQNAIVDTPKDTHPPTHRHNKTAGKKPSGSS